MKKASSRLRFLALLALPFAIACRSQTSSVGADEHAIATASASATTSATAIATTTTTAPTSTSSAVSAIPMRTPKLHRTTASTCNAPRPAGTVIVPPPISPDYRAEIAKPDHHDCLVDGDCKSGKNGRCLIEEQRFRGAKVGTFARCSYDVCVNDADCGSANVCICRNAFGGRRENICVNARCTTDADCGSNSSCSPTLAISQGGCRSEGLPYAALRCHTSNDECIDDSDCRGGACAYSESKSHWICDARVCLPD